MRFERWGVLLLLPMACSKKTAPETTPTAGGASVASVSSSSATKPASKPSSSSKEPAHAELGQQLPLAGPAIRLPLLNTHSIVEQDDSTAFDFDLGVSGRLLGMRFASFLKPPPPKDSNIKTERQMCSEGVVTTRVASWWCMAVDSYVVAPPESRSPDGYISGTLEVNSYEWLEPEGDPIPITLARLMRDDVKDPAALTTALCKSEVPAGGLPEHDGLTDGQKPTAEALCDPSVFVLLPTGLRVLTTTSLSTYTFTLECGVTIPWRKFGRNLRPSGAACSFEWQSETAEGADAKEPDPCL